MSDRTSKPSQALAASAELVRRGSTRTGAPRCPRPLGGDGRRSDASRALGAQHDQVGLFSLAIWLGRPPVPKTVARLATDGACQVRLQLSMLLLPRTIRESFGQRSDLVGRLGAAEVPTGTRASAGRCRSRAARSAAIVRSSASSHVAGLSSPPSCSHEGLGQANLRLRHECLRFGPPAGDLRRPGERTPVRASRRPMPPDLLARSMSCQTAVFSSERDAGSLRSIMAVRIGRNGRCRKRASAAISCCRHSHRGNVIRRARPKGRGTSDVEPPIRTLAP